MESKLLLLLKLVGHVGLVLIVTAAVFLLGYNTWLNGYNKGLLEAVAYRDSLTETVNAFQHCQGDMLDVVVGRAEMMQELPSVGDAR